MPLFWLLLAGAGALYLGSREGHAPPRPPLDPGIPPDVRTAVTFAYLYERNPAHLQAFAATLPPDLPLAAHLLFRKSGQSVQGLQLVGNIFDLDNYTDAASTAVSTTIDVVTHPADTASGTWHAITHPSQSIGDFANALVDALHAIPGMNEAGELLKDFARTSVGEWCLRVMATFGYFVMAPYLGAQLAAISFALPGTVKAEPFVASWITETMDRVIKTINILLAGALGNVSRAADEAVNKALAEVPDVQALTKEFTEQIGKGTRALTDRLGAAIAKKIKDGASDAFDSVTKKLAAEYGYPPNFEKLAREAGIREDNAAAAFDLLARTDYQGSTTWDPYTGEDVAAHLYRARFEGVQGGQTSSTTAYRDPRTLSVQELDARRHVSIQSMLDKSPRKWWVDYYVARAAFAEAGQIARNVLGPPPLETHFGSLASGEAGPTSGGAYVPQIYVPPPTNGGFPTTFHRIGS